MSPKPWELAFTAEPVEVAALRRIMRLHLGIWGLHDISDEAQLCVSELVSNVITHVGHGTPATLAVSVRGTHLRIEVHDPDTRALPVLREASAADCEDGRGMALVDAVADRWGVVLRPDRKVTWCELAIKTTGHSQHVDPPSVVRAEALLQLYAAAANSLRSTEASRLASAVAEETVIAAITDLLHWLHAHGRDADDTLDRAQMRFEAEYADLREGA
ncbi:ATP-binding protein [Streptomyces sp. NPDC019990]|uniref:ATP-binding protein n=1 Tax=Streptomyces sp. NPDC019990 TaxID=3154693 RepID=UPI0033FB360D